MRWRKNGLAEHFLKRDVEIRQHKAHVDTLELPLHSCEFI